MIGNFEIFLSSGICIVFGWQKFICYTMGVFRLLFGIFVTCGLEMTPRAHFLSGFDRRSIFDWNSNPNKIA